MSSARIVKKTPFEPITAGAGEDKDAVVYTLRPGLQGACLLYTRSGSAWFESGGITWNCQPHDVVLLLPPQRGVIRYGSAAPTFRWSTYWTHFEPRTHWFPWFTWPTFAPGVTALRLRGDNVTARNIRSLFKSACEPPSRDFDERYHAVEAILLACRRIDPNAKLSRDERLQRAIDYVTLHYAEQITIGSLTRAAGISPAQLSRLFTRHIGMQPRDFIEAVRMRHANWLLDQTDLPILEVARRCGFADAHYFSNRFKLFQGKGPRELRRELKRSAAVAARRIKPACKPGGK